MDVSVTAPRGPARPPRTLAGVLLATALLLSIAPPRTSAASRPPASPSATAQPLPACSYADLPAEATGYDDWRLTLVDTAYRLPAGYTPPDLVDIGSLAVGSSRQLRSFVVADLNAMGQAASDAGAPFAVQSAFRSEDYQAGVFASMVVSRGTSQALSLSARPGHSEHELGTTIDLTDAPGQPAWQGDDWGKSPAGAWLAENSWQYGFINSYPRDSSPSRTCYAYEPWHYRYFGKETAAAIHDSGLSAREYLWTQQNPARPADKTSARKPSGGGFDPMAVVGLGSAGALVALIFWLRLRSKRAVRRPMAAQASRSSRRSTARAASSSTGRRRSQVSRRR